MDANDVSKRTVLVLLVITVLVSVVGTWTVLNSMDSTHVEWTAKGEPSAGQIKLNVLPDSTPEPDLTTGNVVFNVLPQ